MIAGAIFDLWNTLISPQGPRFVERLAHLVGTEVDEVQDYLRATGCLHEETNHFDIAADLWRLRNGAPPPGDFRGKVEAAANDFLESTSFIPGARDVIDVLATRGIKVAVVSNATSLSVRAAEHLGVPSFIADLRISCRTGYLKPDPRAFTSVSNEWRLPTEQVVVIGDKISTDVLGARLAGMQAIWFAPHLTRNHHETHTNLLAVVKDLRAIPPIISPASAVSP